MARRHEKTMAGRIFENILFLEEVFGTRMMPISRMYRFSNWQNALNCLTQEPCAPPEDARNLGRFGNSAGELPNHRANCSVSLSGTCIDVEVGKKRLAFF